MEITAFNFYKIWCEITESKKDELTNIWSKKKDYTKLVFNSDEALLKKIATKFDIKCYTTNYYSLDAIFYTENDLVPNRPQGSYWFRNIQIAFEHEHTFGFNLLEEVSHLLLTNCSLKVLVTYPDGKKSPDVRKQIILDSIHGIIKGVPHSTELAEKENYLLILGYLNPFRWEGHIFKPEGWQLLLDPAQ